MKSDQQTTVRLLQTADEDYFLDFVDEFYSSIQAHPANYKVVREKNRHGRLKSWLVRKLAVLAGLHQLRIKLGSGKDINFAAMISGDFRLMIPNAFRSRRNYIYMFDVWPRFHHWIFPLLDFFKISYVFFSSQQVYQDYLKKYPTNRCKAMWLPEAIKSEDYHFQSLADKNIDVLEFGRSYEAYHNLIAEALQAQQKNHVFKSPGTQVLFPGKAAFTTALSQSKIVICVPSSVSHPERAEYISTMTLRYLQAMSSKCLIVGILPSDMEEAFGYLPIVEIDMENAAAQLISILNNYEDYLPLIEKNYQEVVSSHQWLHRWKVIQQTMEETA